MKRKIFIQMLFVFVACAPNSAAIAQQQISTTKHATSEDSVAMNALVLYPSNIRIDIFEACEYPSAIVDIATLQKKISSDFADLVSPYAKNDQENLWNLSRYPNLVSDLVNGGKKSDEQISAIVSRYPADIREDAMKCGRNQYEILQQMEELHNQTNAKFADIISDYPPTAQNALRELIQYPEILNLLNDHLDMTVRVGGHYRRDPQEVIRKADERNMEVVRQNAEDAEAWKQNMEQNPDQAQDLKNAATDYATENGYTSDEINTVPNPEYISNYTCSPYSYWFGYPTWYPYSYWYPYPFWFDCGFYYGPGGNMVFFGHPSYYFTNWYFYNPEHIHHYPRLCNTYVDHYYGPRKHVGGSDVIVRKWVNDNRNYLPKDFTNNRLNRVETIRQVGQLNVEARKAQGRNNISPGEREQYYQKNSTKYPALKADYPAIKENENKHQNINNIAEPEKQPAIRIPKQQQQPAMVPRQDAPQQNQQDRRPPENNFNTIQRAQEYHRNAWEGTQPSRPQAPSYSQPAQRAQPQQQQPTRPMAPSNNSPAQRRK